MEVFMMSDDKNRKKSMPAMPLKPYPATTDYEIDKQS